MNFMRAWEPFTDCQIIVVEDMPEKTFRLDEKIIHVSWKEIDDDLRQDSWIISRRDSAIRSYGFLLAYRMGCEYYFTLDDDCMPYSGHDFINGHLRNLNETPKWISSVPGMRVRGLPYKNLGNLSDVVANVGLWSGNPDIDAIQSLSQSPINDFVPQSSNHIIPAGQYMPICGMNLSFRRKIACLSYFPFMGKGSPYARFDDIWFGVILKKVCDHLKLHISYGAPFIFHSRASDPFINLAKEAPGICANESFWQIVDNISLTARSTEACLREIGEHFQSTDLLNGYIRELGKRLLCWLKYFN